MGRCCLDGGKQLGQSMRKLMKTNVHQELLIRSGFLQDFQIRSNISHYWNFQKTKQNTWNYWCYCSSWEDTLVFLSKRCELFFHLYFGQSINSRTQILLVLKETFSCHTVSPCVKSLVTLCINVQKTGKVQRKCGWYNARWTYLQSFRSRLVGKNKA